MREPKTGLASLVYLSWDVLTKINPTLWVIEASDYRDQYDGWPTTIRVGDSRNFNRKEIEFDSDGDAVQATYVSPGGLTAAFPTLTLRVFND